MVEGNRLDSIEAERLVDRAQRRSNAHWKVNRTRPPLPELSLFLSTLLLLSLTHPSVRRRHPRYNRVIWTSQCGQGS